jgi:hypothetical protein
LDLVRLVCEKMGADIDLKDADEENAFVKAVDSGYLEVAKYLHRRRSRGKGSKGGGGGGQVKPKKKKGGQKGRTALKHERKEEMEECVLAAEANSDWEMKAWLLETITHDSAELAAEEAMRELLALEDDSFGAGAGGGGSGSGVIGVRKAPGGVLDEETEGAIVTIIGGSQGRTENLQGGADCTGGEGGASAGGGGKKKKRKKKKKKKKKAGVLDACEGGEGGAGGGGRGGGRGEAREGKECGHIRGMESVDSDDEEQEVQEEREEQQEGQAGQGRHAGGEEDDGGGGDADSLIAAMYGDSTYGDSTYGADSLIDSLYGSASVTLDGDGGDGGAGGNIYGAGGAAGAGAGAGDDVGSCNGDDETFDTLADAILAQHPQSFREYDSSFLPVSSDEDEDDKNGEEHDAEEGCDGRTQHRFGAGVGTGVGVGGSVIGGGGGGGVSGVGFGVGITGGPSTVLGNCTADSTANGNAADATCGTASTVGIAIDPFLLRAGFEAISSDEDDEDEGDDNQHEGGESRLGELEGQCGVGWEGKSNMRGPGGGHVMGVGGLGCLDSDDDEVGMMNGAAALLAT